MEAKQSLLYGIRNASLSSAASALAIVLGLKWNLGDSLEMGDYYHWGGFREENFALFRNYSPLHEELLHPEYAEYSILLGVNFTQRPEQLQRLLSAAMEQMDLTLLKTFVWNDED